MNTGKDTAHRNRTLAVTGIVLLGLAGAFALSRPGEEVPNEASAPADQTPPVGAASVPAIDPAKLEAFNQAVKKEPKVIDFVYDPKAVFQWTIGVRDDGTPRYGYAEYFCILMGEHGLSRQDAKVRIVDYAKFMQPGGNARDASLGSVDCATGEHALP